MPSINKCIVFLSLALSATAISSGHVARSGNHQLVARHARPDVLGGLAAPVNKRKLSNSKRCKTKPTTTSSTKQAAKTPTKNDDAPTTTHTPTSSKKDDDPKPTTSKSSGGGGGGSGATHSGGQATFYTQNGVEGACGKAHSDNDIICALDTPTYAGGSHCGDYVAITNVKNGKTVNVLVADECPTCSGANSIDLSKGAFFALGGTVDEGVFPITWQWA